VVVRHANQEHADSLSRLDTLALTIAKYVGTMYFFFFCCVLVFVPFAVPSTLSLVLFISSGFLQLILLPIIVISGNLQSRHMEVVASIRYENDVKLLKAIENLVKK
jgi:hypothetical protein